LETINTRHAKISIEALPTVQSDSEQMRQLLMALLSNALIFQKKDTTPSVSVSMVRQNQQCVFTVRDNGIGIDPKFHECIFHPFKRLHPDGEYPGIGMGLAIARKIVDRHGGRIWVDSTPGKGSAFMFSIPDRMVA
jgi:light-regulated signal transduction histidine kinase (bacteriophytochrome)